MDEVEVQLVLGDGGTAAPARSRARTRSHRSRSREASLRFAPTAAVNGLERPDDDTRVKDQAFRSGRRGNPFHMGLLDSLRALLWAHRRSPEQVRYFLSVGAGALPAGRAPPPGRRGEQAGLKPSAAGTISNRGGRRMRRRLRRAGTRGCGWERWDGLRAGEARHGRHRADPPLQPGRRRTVGRDARAALPGARLPRGRQQRGDEQDPRRSRVAGAGRPIKRTEEALTIIMRRLDGQRVDFRASSSARRAPANT